MAIATELQELVDAPNETLDVEYKSWLDLAGNNEARADLARHIAALANHGGGAIVFGFTDDFQIAGADPNKINFTRDLVAGIVKKYLEPPFQCDVHIVRSIVGNNHPVIVVPPHGSAPVCAKAGGPVVSGRPKGIVQGAYYTRKPGPSSDAILTAAEWAPIIRRCAMHERAAIIGAVDAALRGAGGSSAAPDELRIWHDAAERVFLNDVAEQKAPAELAKRHFQFSYGIERPDGQRLLASQLIESLKQVNAEVRKRTPSSWTGFHVFTRPEIEPAFVQDAASGQGDNDFLECALLRDPNPGVEGANHFWRVSADGKATIIRSYSEDREHLNKQLRKKPGAWLSPNWMVTSLIDFVCHAAIMAERFDAPSVVSFRCEWRGLSGRHLYDTEAEWLAQWFDHRRARGGAQGDHRVVARTWPVGRLTSGWDEIVVELIGPVMRIFAPDFEITIDWIRRHAPNWRD